MVDFTPMRGMGKFALPKHDRGGYQPAAYQTLSNEHDDAEPDSRHHEAVPQEDEDVAREDTGNSVSMKTPRTIHTGNDPLDIAEAEALYEEIQEKGVDLEDLPEDVWSVLLYCIIQDLTDIVEGKADWHDFVRFPYGLGCAIINMLLQFTFIYWIAKFVSLPSVRSAQDMYRRYHAEAFKDGQLDEKQFDALGDFRHDICGLVLSNYYFLFAVLFLWLALCTSEMKSVLRTARMLARLPDLPKGISPRNMYIECHNGECDKLFALTPRFRMAIWVLCLVPQAAIIIAVAVFGCVWLTATASFADLILNSLALGFVARIDDLLFNALLPEMLTEKLIVMKCAMPPIEVDPDTDFRQQYTQSGGIVVGLVVFVALFLKFQPVLPSFAWDLSWQCQRIHREDDIPWCLAWKTDCFPV